MHMRKRDIPSALLMSEQPTHPEKQSIPVLTEHDVTFEQVTGGGPGGQSVNKTASKARVRFHIAGSRLSEEQKAKVRERLSNRINKADELVLDSQTERSLQQNKTIVLERLNRMIADALTEQAERKPTEQSRASKERDKRRSKAHSEAKKRRRDKGQDGW